MPKYLICHIIRFYYKIENNTKAKLLMSVPFKKTLDIYDYLTPELKSEIKPFKDATINEQIEDT